MVDDILQLPDNDVLIEFRVIGIEAHDVLVLFQVVPIDGIYRCDEFQHLDNTVPGGDGFQIVVVRQPGREQHAGLGVLLFPQQFDEFVGGIV